MVPLAFCWIVYGTLSITPSTTLSTVKSTSIFSMKSSTNHANHGALSPVTSSRQPSSNVPTPQLQALIKCLGTIGSSSL